tara:strand:+ start:10519 stop:11454 length:936 start_codon:yes stop_codon:yes gene_type:complete
MSKIKINEIESLSSNGDLTISPNGSGVFEVAGEDASGTLQLSKVKIKAPSTAQNYTMVLPATDINLSTNKILKVDTITGSGSTAVGQLAYTDLPEPDLTQLDASELTTGTVPAARIPNPIPATSGAAFKLVSTSTVSSGSPVSSIEFTLDDNSLYKLLGIHIATGNSGGSTQTSDGMTYLLKSSTGQIQNLVYDGYYADWMTTGTSHSAYALGVSGSQAYLYTKWLANVANAATANSIFEFSTGDKNAWLYSKLRERAFGNNEFNFHEARGSIDNSYTGDNEFRTLTIVQSNGSHRFINPTEFRLYKYMEA